jgi:uncharacterized protein DUF6962
VKIAEPATAITDYILAAETLFLGILLIRGAVQTPVKLWAAAFFVLAIAAIAGGTFHGLIASLDPLAAHILWKVTLVAVGIATFCMLSAAILIFTANPARTILLVAAVLQFCVYAFFIARGNDFKIVIFDYVPAMILIVVLGYAAKAQSAGFLLGAVVLSFAAAGIQNSSIQLHRNFNHNDLYHVIQMIAMYLFYRAGKLL